MAVNLKAYTGPNGVTDNMGGLLGYWFLGVIDDMIQIPFVQDPNIAVNHVELVTAATNFTFKTGKGFAKMYTTKNTGKVKHASNGGTDGRGFNSEAEFFWPGDEAEPLGILKYAKNNRLIALCPRPNGKIWMVGTDRYPADIEYSYDSSDNNGSGVAGTSIKIMTTEITPILYTGTITLIP